MKLFGISPAKQVMVYLIILSSSLSALAVDMDELKFSADFYASHSNLVTFKGYQDDASLTFKMKYTDFFLEPFAKVSTSHYYYLDETILNNTTYSTAHKNELSLGLDVIILPILKLRYIYDFGRNLVTNTDYQQDAYILIYNQFMDFTAFQLNNYAESAVFPRISTNKLNTYIRIQALKSFDLARSIDTSHVIYPFIQVKARDNEERLFGLYCNLCSVGLGYKVYSKFEAESSAAFLLEGHSVFYQSKDFNSDWFQVLAVLQYGYN